MNSIEISLKQSIVDAVETLFGITLTIDDVVIEIPREKTFGDYATNIAMRLAKTVKRNPKEIALSLQNELLKSEQLFRQIEVAGPGFINLFLQQDNLAKVIETVLTMQERFGESDYGKQLKVNLEYVSANPTGDLHPGHARGAAMGDSVARIMRKAGYDVTREYYINDAGNQIRNMALSVQARYLQSFGIDAPLPEDGYFGPDIIEIARKFKEIHGDRYVNDQSEDALNQFRAFGLQEELLKLKNDLLQFGVAFDVWSSERAIYEAQGVEKVLKRLEALDMTYQQDGAVWLKTTLYGDDKDRVLVKSDGTYTYLTPDIAYHLNKFDRGFEKLVDFLGADHHGYIQRMKAAIKALGYDNDALEIDIIQMARMIKDGVEFKLSKRSGKAIALRDLIEEAGVDAVRYFFVSRAADTQMDFDLDLATKKSNDNPVYYAQYAHARMCSILRQGTQFDTAASYELLDHPKEIALLKYINEFTSVVQDAAQSRQPHKVCNYIQKIAALFHSFYNDCKVLDTSNPMLSAQRLALVQATKITLANALYLIGVNAPESM